MSGESFKNENESRNETSDVADGDSSGSRELTVCSVWDLVGTDNHLAGLGQMAETTNRNAGFRGECPTLENDERKGSLVKSVGRSSRLR